MKLLIITPTELLLYIGIALLWAAVVLLIKSERKKVIEIKSSLGGMDSITGAQPTSIPGEFRIALIQDQEVDIDGLVDLTLNISDLVKGTYRIPERFIKGERPMSPIEHEEPTRNSVIDLTGVKEEDLVNPLEKNNK